MAAKYHRDYEFRCPVHGFVTLSDWEREIISQPAFQRLRRIRQLAWTDQVYPGAMHTRFEHSLGVMHIAAAIYDSVKRSSKDILLNDLQFTEDGLVRDRLLVRLTALLHDVGHSPFSHAAEELFPLSEEDGHRYVHEEYSAAIIRGPLRDVIENHPLNQNYSIKADDIANLIESPSRCGRSLVWRDIITGQMDADRIDYLLRDSLHTGVHYGKFDWQRLIGCQSLVPREESSDSFRLGVTEGGLHAAEALVLARYFMFTQIYFHKTRVAFDRHLQHALEEILPGGHFPAPTDSGIQAFLNWDDWMVLGKLSEGGGGEHGRRLRDRDHFREVYHSPETPDTKDLRRFQKVCDALGSLLQCRESAEKSWYKVDPTDIPVQSDNPGKKVAPLSTVSTVVAGLKPIRKRMAYCRQEDTYSARDIIASIKERQRKESKK